MTSQSSTGIGGWDENRSTAAIRSSRGANRLVDRSAHHLADRHPRLGRAPLEALHALVVEEDLQAAIQHE